MTIIVSLVRFSIALVDPVLEILESRIGRVGGGERFEVGAKEKYEFLDPGSGN